MAYKSKYTGQQIDEAVEKALSASGGGGGGGLYQHVIGITSNPPSLSFTFSFSSSKKEQYSVQEFAALCGLGGIYGIGIFSPSPSNSISIVTAVGSPEENYFLLSLLEDNGGIFEENQYDLDFTSANSFSDIVTPL